MPTIISQNTTWKSGDVINLADDVQVASGVTLKVEPGTTINGNFRTITVFGNLDIKGTINSNVTTENLNIALSSNSKQLGNIQFDYVTFNNGSFLLGNGYGMYGSFDVLNSNFTNVRGFYISYPKAPSTFLGNTFYKSSGLSIGTSGDGSVLIKNNSFVEQSTAYAIESWANYNSGITVVNNSFLSTTKVALALKENYENAALNATDNYFGTSDLSIINRMIRDKTDSLNYASVISTSYTDKPSAGTPIFDSTPPTILVSGNITSVKAGEAVTIKFVLNENATDFTVDDISTSGGTLTNFDGFGTSYSAKFTPADNSTINGVISVASGKFSDTAGNLNADGADANNTLTIIVDSVPPTIAITADKISLKTGDTATIKFTLNESSTEFTSEDISVSGGTLINFTGSGSNYTAIFAPTANASGNGLVSVASGKFSDRAGNLRTH